MGVRDALQVELAAAMRRRDSAVVSVLRIALSELANAQAQPPTEMQTSTTGSVHVAGAAAGPGAAEAPRIHRSEDQQRAIVADELAALTGHVERLAGLCRWEEADAARRAAQALGRILSDQGS